MILLQESLPRVGAHEGLKSGLETGRNGVEQRHLLRLSPGAESALTRRRATIAKTSARRFRRLVPATGEFASEIWVGHGESGEEPARHGMGAWNPDFHAVKAR